MRAIVFLALLALTGAAGRAADAWQRIDDNDAAVSYSPDVTQSGPDPSSYDGGFHYFSTPGDWCTVTFKGTGIRWIGGKNTNHGDAVISIDGKVDTTVSTQAPSWLKDQDLYTKTGLADGPHTLRIEDKSGYQDFDAFEYLGAPPAPIVPPTIGGTLLPAQVPYLNPPHRYAIGSGVALAVANVAGDWSQLAGPGYTRVNLIDSEQLTLEIDGEEQPLRFQMKRAAQTGLYYGVATRGDLQLVLVDFTRLDQPWLARLLVINNQSATAAHDVRVRDKITPGAAAGIKRGLVLDAGQNRCGVFMRSSDLLFNGPTAEGTAVAAFTDPAATAFHTDAVYTIETSPSRIAPKGTYQTALCHWFHTTDTTDAQCVAAARALDVTRELAKSIHDWQAWFANVPPGYQLSNIKDGRARTLVEGGLSVIKTNQSSDGGFAANISFFREGFFRDTVLGLHGLAATGHFEESRRWLLWANNVFAYHGHIPDCASIMPSLPDDKEAFDMGNVGVEGPAYVLLCARNYLAGTHDFATLRGVDKMLRFCMEEQLQQAIANGDKLEFNGDETEVCGAVEIGPAGTLERVGIVDADWSLTSVALCAASLDFYIRYVKEIGEDPAAYHSTLAGTTLDLPAELAHLVAAMDRDFWRTNVPELPAGFHDAFRLKKDGAWPLHRIANLTLMPAYFGTPYAPGEKAKDVAAIAHYFDPKTGFLQLVPDANTGFDGHDLGYLLWGLVETRNPAKDAVYAALVNGPTCDAWGAFNEAYDGKGMPNDHDLRTMETGVNISAIAKYWNLGEAAKSDEK